MQDFILITVKDVKICYFMLDLSISFVNNDGRFSFFVSRLSFVVCLKKGMFAECFRARVKSGLRILSATPSTDQWNITVEINPKHTGASVTALRREPQEPDQGPPPQAGE